ncbi:MAG: OadG family protein [Pseudomonadales bacterium]|nr:OadG family protein [Pseudomonadales bacterium]MCP5184787.1 OadG family protein [Pseudomonadales bacterium]
MFSGMLGQGVELMVAGMGTVFVFLTVLVGATSIMSSMITRFLPPPLPAAPAAAPPQPESSSNEEIAAITAALAMHRARKGGG